ncbi:MAG: hypothetical protein Q4B60_01600 [Erysipelotrichaceae bacterium]|nr:hypothetical protein [Erysipelotrichaceae bacterium]
MKLLVEIDRKVHEIEGESARSLFDEINKIQDMITLLDSAICFGTSFDQKDIEKLKTLINSYEDNTITMEDIIDLEIHLSVCDIKVINA